MKRPYIVATVKKPKVIDPTDLALSTAAEFKTVALLDAIKDGVKVGIILGGAVAALNLFGHITSQS